MARSDSGFGRTLRIASMTAGISGSYLGYLAQRAFLGEEQRARSLKATHARAGRRMSEGMSELRGPIMKLGQLLSLQTDTLPAETLAELMTLQMEAPPMHPSLARAQFRASLRAEPDEVFARFDDSPFAAASLGQVHRAITHDGRDVAVKIQYPGIASAIASDFRLLRAMALPARLSKVLPTNVLDELQEQIVAETGYVREARNLTLFHDELRPLPFVEIPKVLREYSTDRVLTMSLIPGVHLDVFLKQRPSQRLRDRVGAHLFELHYFQLLGLGAFHADPNWGNYLFRPDGSIGLIDFGCVKYVPDAFRENLRQIFLYPGPKRSPAFRALLDRRYALSGATLSARARVALIRFSERFYERVYPPDPALDERPFDFSDRDFQREYLTESTNVARAKGALPEYVFLARAETGLYQTLHRLKARVRTSQILRRHLGDLSRDDRSVQPRRPQA